MNVKQVFDSDVAAPAYELPIAAGVRPFDRSVDAPEIVAVATINGNNGRAERRAHDRVQPAPVTDNAKPYPGGDAGEATSRQPIDSRTVSCCFDGRADLDRSGHVTGIVGW